MPEEEIPHEDELESRQGKLYPVGRALRRTFDAENHDSLGTDLTGLMLELTRIDTDATPGRGALPAAIPPAPIEAPTPAPGPPPDKPRGWWRGAVDRLLR